MYSLGLANAMTSILCLLVHGWVPVSIVKDDTVSSRQVDSYTTTPRRGDKAENLRIEVKLIDHFLPSFHLDRSIQSHICVSMKIQEIL